jgi:hypothetical protein
VAAVLRGPLLDSREIVMEQTLEHDALIYGTDEALVETLVPCF